MSRAAACVAATAITAGRELGLRVRAGRASGGAPSPHGSRHGAGAAGERGARANVRPRWDARADWNWRVGTKPGARSGMACLGPAGWPVAGMQLAGVTRRGLDRIGTWIRRLGPASWARMSTPHDWYKNTHPSLAGSKIITEIDRPDPGECRVCMQASRHAARM